MSNRTIPLAIIGVVVIGAVLGYFFFLRPSQNDPPLLYEETPVENEKLPVAGEDSPVVEEEPPVVEEEPSEEEKPLVVIEELPSAFPEIRFTTTDGNEFTIDDLIADGKPLVIYFFATWCPTCGRDLRNLNVTFPIYEDEINVLVVGSDPTEPLVDIRDYKDERNYPWPFAVYNKDAITEFKIVSQASKVGISLDGEVVFTKGYGVVSVDGWEDLFQELT